MPHVSDSIIYRSKNMPYKVIYVEKLNLFTSTYHFVQISIFFQAFLTAVMFKCFSVTLSNIIQRNFPEEYAERRSEHETMTYAGVDLMPLFVMDVVLPSQKMALNIFEPRYRLMVKLLQNYIHFYQTRLLIMYVLLYWSRSQT